ncbi:hypothetical protein K1X76_04110 [bacterium]|nr:hypothetical protein [bacterium]
MDKLTESFEILKMSAKLETANLAEMHPHEFGDAWPKYASFKDTGEKTMTAEALSLHFLQYAFSGFEQWSLKNRNLSNTYVQFCEFSHLIKKGLEKALEQVMELMDDLPDPVLMELKKTSQVVDERLLFWADYYKSIA